MYLLQRRVCVCVCVRVCVRVCFRHDDVHSCLTFFVFVEISAETWKRVSDLVYSP